MTVYVDNMRLRAKLFRWNGVWSNLWADTTEELIDFASEELGLSPSSLVDKGYTTERYIINELRRLEAIRCGAVPLAYMGAGTYKLIRRKREDLNGQWKEKDL